MDKEGDESGDSNYSDCEDQSSTSWVDKQEDKSEETNDMSRMDDSNRRDTDGAEDDGNLSKICGETVQSKVENNSKKCAVEDEIDGSVRTRDSATSHINTVVCTQNADTSLTCDSIEHSTELKSENIETDSLNSVGDLVVDDHSANINRESDVLVHNKDSAMVKSDEDKKGEVVPDLKLEIDTSKMDTPNEKQQSDSDLSKTDSQSNASIDRLADDTQPAETKKKKSDTKSTSKQKKDSVKKSDSLATKIKDKISKKTDSSKKTEKVKKSDTSDKLDKKSDKTVKKSDKADKKSDKKCDKKDEKGDTTIKSKLSNLKSEVSKLKSSGSKTQQKSVSQETELPSAESKSVLDESESVPEESVQEQSKSVQDETKSVTDDSGRDESNPIAIETNLVGIESESVSDESKNLCLEQTYESTDFNDEKTPPIESEPVTSDVTSTQEKSNINEKQDIPEIEISSSSSKEVNENSPGPELRKKKTGKDVKSKSHVHHAGDHDHVDDDFSMADFGSLSKQAEQRLATRRAAREEARLIRMKELERQQRDMEEKQDRIYELTRDSGARGFSTTTSRRGSDDSTSSEDTRELKKQVAELEERYKKAMMNNAQLDNEKQKYRYDVDILKDKYEDIEENHIEIQRLHKDRCKELDQKKRDLNDVQIEVEYLKLQITQRDKLIQEYGLVFVSNEAVEDENDKKKKRRRRKKEEQELDTAALVTPDALTVLGKVQGNLDERLKHFADDQHKMEEEIKKLRIELDEERAKNVLSEKYNSPKSHKDSSMNGPSSDGLAHEANMEAQKQLTEYRYKLKKAEQDITALEGNVIRLESQVKRFKSSSDEGEKTVEDMKLDKRKLQRDLRDAQYKVEELNSQNQNLHTRIKTLKQERIDSIISGKS